MGGEAACSGAAEAGGGRVFTRPQDGTPHDAGASSVEYGLIVFAIAAAVVIAVFALGRPVFAMFDNSCQVVKSEIEGPSSSCP
jgi:Flp pilus assembly pilin Flp